MTDITTTTYIPVASKNNRVYALRVDQAGDKYFLQLGLVSDASGRLVYPRLANSSSFKFEPLNEDRCEICSAKNLLEVIDKKCAYIRSF